VKDKIRLIAKTLFGLEAILAKELEDLGAENLEIHSRAVSFDGDKHLMYKANMCLRTALRILKPIHSFKAKDENELYKGVQEVFWSSYMSLTDTFAVDTTISSPYFKHSQYVSQKTKDAIVDQFRKKTGERPSVDIENPRLLVNLFISDDTCSISVDSSGQPLFKRGYRTELHVAPINEVLAAGIVQLSGWDKQSLLIDPMCGSGTILIEAALLAMNIPPCFNRQRFGFMNWRDYDAKLWESIVDEANAQTAARSQFNVPIIGCDISIKAYKAAKTNIENIFLDKKIELSVADFEEYIPPHQNGTVIMNPPYGERIQIDDLNQFYKMMGSRMKHQFAGYNVWIISSNEEAINYLGLHPSQKFDLFNGSLECKLMKFSIYEGSKKTRKAKPDATAMPTDDLPSDN